MKTADLKCIEKFKAYTVLVIGDFMIDAYFYGSSNRLAPEAPVPVIDVNLKKYCLGGAANVAANLAALGCKVQFCTVTGADAAAENGLKLLEAAGIETRYVLTDADRKTLVKTRMVSGTQTLLRCDEGTCAQPGQATEAKLKAKIAEVYAKCDAVLIADYDKGVLTPLIIDTLLALKKDHPKFIAVDAKRISAFAKL